MFTPKVDQIFDDPKESLLVVKNSPFWEMTPGYPTLWVWCRKIVETSKTGKILLYFGKWQICPLFVSRPNTYEWVSESLKCTKVAVNDFVGCIWMQTNNFTPENYSELQRNFVMFFWEMTPGYPTWCRVGRVVLSRNDKLLLGEKSPSTYLGIIERGKRTQLDLGGITFGRVVSSDSSVGDHLQLIFVETNTIVFERNYLGSSCLMQPSMGTLNSPSSRIVKDSTPSRRRILRYINFGIGKS